MSIEEANGVRIQGVTERPVQTQIFVVRMAENVNA